MLQNYQILISKALLSGDRRAMIYIDMIDENDFDYEPAKFVIHHCKMFYKKYNTLPSAQYFSSIEIDDKIKNQVLDIVQNPLSAEDTVVGEHFLVEYLKKRNLTRCLREAAEKLEANKIDEAERVLTSYKPLEIDFDGGIRVLEDAKKLINKIEAEPNFTPTLIFELDKYINGGFVPGDLVVVIGLTGSGKTTFLCHLAKAAAWVRRNTLFITLEMSEEEISKKILSSFTGQAIFNVAATYDKVKALKILEHARKVCSDVTVKQFAAGTRINDLLAYIKHVNKICHTDIVLIDYADLVRTNDFEERRFELESIFRSLKSFAQEMNCVIVTPSQANRYAANAETTDIHHVAESFAKVTIADIVIVVEKSKNDKKMYLRVVKNRRGPTVRDIKVRINWETGTISTGVDE